MRDRVYCNVPLDPGTRLGAHEIVGLLGAGGMGEVYRATDTRLKRDVALKVLPDAFSHDPDRLARFQREAELLASLNHPNIGAIYGLEQRDTMVAIVLELVEGETLADVIARGPLALADALPIAHQIAEALEAAHDKGVVHRDLKPANIKVTPDGRVKVLDFGLAKMLETDPKSSAMSMSPTLSVHATYAGIILGTAAYMSPEQARGKPVDRRTDVWAFGCVVYEMLTGKHAFEPGETVSDAIASVLTREPDLTTLPADTPPAIRRLLRRCLQKDPQQRLPHIGAARLEIDEARSGSPEDATVPASLVPAPPVRASARRRAMPWIAAAAGVVAAAAIAGSGAWWLKPEAARTVTRFNVLLPEGQGFSNTGRQLVALSPDGSNLVYVANSRLFIRSMSTLEAHAIAGSEAGGTGVTSPAFSPDGQSLAFWSVAERAVKRLAVSGGAPVTICPSENPLGLSWEERGIVFGQPGKGIMRVSPSGGTPEVIAPLEADESACCPQLLPGRAAVLFTVRKNQEPYDKARIVAHRLDMGTRTTVIEGGSDGRYLSTGHLVYVLAGVLFAVPFDAKRLETTGGPVPVLEGVRRTAGTGNAAAGSVGLAQFSVADSGTIAYLPGPATLAEGNSDLGLFDRSGKMQALKLPPGSYRAPRVSPDGKTVAFDNEDAKDANVWMYDLAGGGAPRRLTNGGRNRSPVWSPDGQWIAFQSERDGDAAIFRQRADGSGLAERLTKPDAGARHSPQSWSRDGTSLLMTVEKGNQFALWTLSISDKQTAPFDDVKSVIQIDASFSPDGRWVAYHMRESLRQSASEVFLQPFPSTGVKHLVPQQGGAPYWLPKTNELVLNIGPLRSAAIAVTTTPRIAFGRPTDFSRVGRVEVSPSTSRRNVDAMPDGEHVIGVVLASGVEGNASQITVVLNWLDEVRQRAPAK
jgi:serine/threonine-protein kinase